MKNPFTKKLFPFRLLCVLLAAASLFSACSLKEIRHDVDTTKVDSSLFPTVGDGSMDELPFVVELPEGWAVREEAFLYTIHFDEGTSGYIQIKKSPVEGAWDGLVSTGYEDLGLSRGADLFCRSLDFSTRYCLVRISGQETVYSVSFKDKSMSAERRKEAWSILKSIAADL